MKQARSTQSKVGELTMYGRAPGARRPIVSNVEPKRARELASVNRASETPAMSGRIPCENSWFQTVPYMNAFSSYNFYVIADERCSVS